MLIYVMLFYFVFYFISLIIIFYFGLELLDSGVCSLYAEFSGIFFFWGLSVVSVFQMFK